MESVIASVLVISLMGTPQAEAGRFLEEALLNETLIKMLLYRDTVESWNARTQEAYNMNSTYTVERGECSKEDAGNPPREVYSGKIDGTDYVDTAGINVTKQVITDGCGVIYVGNPVYLEGSRNRSWVGGGTLSIYVGVGCTTRPVNGTWDNDDPNKPGGGYHREYLLPILEETTASVNGVTCYNETVVRGGGYPPSFHSLRMMRINCSVGNDSEARIILRHRCGGYVLLDSAYSVMGWVKACDRERFMKNCLEGCAAANAEGSKSKGGGGGSGGKCDFECCLGVCTDLADHKCMEYKSEKAECPTPPSGTYGGPEDGSSTYFIRKPADSHPDPCYCRHLWDPSNSCINNRVSLAASEMEDCADAADYVVRLSPKLQCNGSYSISDGVLSASLRLDVEPDVYSGFILGDLAYRESVFVPRHILYGMHNESIQKLGYKEYHLADNYYRMNETKNDGEYFWFVDWETVGNSLPLMSGSGFRVLNVTGGGGRYEINFTFFGQPDGLGNASLTVLTMADRIGRPNWTPCDMMNPCGRGVCVDDYCLIPNGALAVNLGGCLTESPPANRTPEIKVNPGLSIDWPPWLVLAAVLALLALAFTIAEGNRALHDVWEKYRGFFM